MKKIELSPSWFIDLHVDWEYQSYVLLNYLQHVDDALANLRLSPYFFDVKYHMSNIECFLNTRLVLEDTDHQISDTSKQRIVWLLRLDDNSFEMEEAMKICKQAYPLLRKRLRAGTKAWKRVEASLRMTYIGRTPVDRSSGFLLVRYAKSQIVEAYRFSGVKDVSINLVEYYDIGDAKDYEEIKSKVMRTKNANPLFIGIESDEAFVTTESVLPVIKKTLTTKIMALPR